MNRAKWWSAVFSLAVLAFLLQLSAIAPAQDDGDDQGQDPPGRVGRLDYSQGSVSFRPAGEDDWVGAVPNRPLVTGDDLWADQDSRAEVHVGSTAIRLGAMTGITFLTLDDNTVQIRLAQGSLIVRVRHVDDDDTYEIDTPNLAFALLQPGEYRVDVSQDGSQSITTVWHGRGRVTGGGFTYPVVAGQSATFTGSDHLDYDLEQVPTQDDFDQWAFDRDASEDQADSANYVSREMTGYEDLDNNGTWSYVPGYGECWQPTAVAVGWAPYRFGHWAWIGPWGWTWVEDEPWGFAPFHYGRWAYVNSGWFWVPGPVVVRPVWAPALVGFVGGGPGYHLAGGGGVGWFPLAPGEVYVPAYQVSRAYVNNVNVTNTNVSVTRVTNVYNTVIINKSTTINNVTYVNQRVSNGVTVVSRDTFVKARPVRQNLMHVDAREIASAPVSRAVAAEPIRASVVGAGRPISVRPPAGVMHRPVVAVRTPPPPPRSIEQRQAQAGGHLNEQALVRPTGIAQPGQMHRGRPQQSEADFRPPGQTANQNPQVKVQPKPQPRRYEAQGNPQPERPNVQPETRYGNAPRQNENAFHAPQQPAPQQSPLVRPAPPVQQRSPEQEQQQAQKFNRWQQQRSASTPQRQESRPQPRQEPQRSAPPQKH